MESIPDGPLAALRASWARSLRARNLSDKTQRSYVEAGRQFDAWLAAERPDVDDVGDVRRGHVEDFMADLLARRSAATANSRYRSLALFFGWCLEEGEVDVSPMAKMHPPLVPEQPVALPAEEDLRKLLAAVAGKDFAARRDTAIIRLFIDTGARRAEIAELRVEDLDLDDQVARVVGKGRRPRVVPFGMKTTQALDRYIRARRTHRLAVDPALWLGDRGKGPISPDGVHQMLGRRAAEAGLSLHPHQLRHHFAHSWLSEGGTEGDLMRLAGWRSRTMLDRYGRAAAEGRARAAHRRMGLGDKL